jgi:hypothetical protein
MEQHMWQILKAEIITDKFKILLVYFFAVVCFIITWFEVELDRNRAPMAMMIMVVATLIISYVCEKKRIAQRRSRLYGVLPISIQQIGCFYFSYPFLAWLGIGILYFLFYFVIQNLSGKTLIAPSLRQMLTLNGMILIVNACYLLTRDVRIVFDKKYHKMFMSIFWVLIYLVALLPFYIMTNSFGIFGENTSLQSYLSEMSKSPIGMNLVGLILSGFSFYIFLKRKSYLE